MVLFLPLNCFHNFFLKHHSPPKNAISTITDPTTLTATTPVCDNRGGVEVGRGVGAIVSVKRGGATETVVNRRCHQATKGMLLEGIRTCDIWIERMMNIV